MDIFNLEWCIRAYISVPHSPIKINHLLTSDYLSRGPCPGSRHSWDPSSHHLQIHSICPRGPGSATYSPTPNIILAHLQRLFFTTMTSFGLLTSSRRVSFDVDIPRIIHFCRKTNQILFLLKDVWIMYKYKWQMKWCVYNPQSYANN